MSPAYSLGERRSRTFNATWSCFERTLWAGPILHVSSWRSPAMYAVSSTEVIWRNLVIDGCGSGRRVMRCLTINCQPALSHEHSCFVETHFPTSLYRSHSPH